MTKSELLVNLAARDGVASLVGDPFDVTPSGDIGVVAWYQQCYWEIRGEAALKQSLNFYVLDEGGAGEAAYYKDSEPSGERVHRSALAEWMRDAIDASPNSYAAIQIHWVSERWEMVVYSILELDGSDVQWQSYYIRKGAGTAKKITNHEAWRLSSIASV